MVYTTTIFTIYEKSSSIEPLRKELKKRGWIEKPCEAPKPIPSFIWLGRIPVVVEEGPAIVNRLLRIPTKNFCYKDIFLDYVRQCDSRENQVRLNGPRAYKLFENEHNEFLDDYCLTAYSSFIRFIIARGSKVFSLSGTINSKWIDFVIKTMETAIDLHKSKSIKDKMLKLTDKVMNSTENESQTNNFIAFKPIYQSVVKHNSKIKIESFEAMSAFLRKCKIISNKSKTVFHHFEDDGFHNLWLLKPARQSRGIGIKLFDDDHKILSYAKKNEGVKYLVQKYIERPMLIYRTKFDIRQNFLIIHHVAGVSLWMYKICYLKFSNKLYNPRKCNLSSHMTNIAVKSKYSVDKERSTLIPESNEWSSDQFLLYLKYHNKLHLWNEKIYPGMKKNIIALASASLDISIVQPNHFHLYSCDFMIDSSSEPVLLEINDSPIFTSIIGSRCLEDLVKVIIDAKGTQSTNTGNFELIWEKSITNLMKKYNVDLFTSFK